MLQLAFNFEGFSFIKKPERKSIFTFPFSNFFSGVIEKVKENLSLPSSGVIGKVTISEILAANQKIENVEAIPATIGEGVGWKAYVNRILSGEGMEISSEQYKSRYSFMLLSWQKQAFRFVKQNADIILKIEMDSKTCSVINCGEFVHFSITSADKFWNYIAYDESEKIELVEE